MLICKQADSRRSPRQSSRPAYDDEKENILCAGCGNQVAMVSHQISINGSFRHVFANPLGIVYEIGCFSESSGCQAQSEPSREFSWFPGFFWQVGACRHCGAHIGWVFFSESEAFYGLIMDKLIFPKNL